MSGIYIFDLDGTLADITHRRGLLPDWPAFYKACSADKPYHEVIRLMHILSDENTIKIWSGRSDIVREQTLDWLEQYTEFERLELEIMLRMRRDGDFTPDEVLKKKWFDELSPREIVMIRGVFDDRDRMVKMWRDLGLTCFQTAYGDF